MAEIGINEGVVLLQEIEYDAAESDVRGASDGSDSGMMIMDESESVVAASLNPEDRTAELRSLSTLELLRVLRQSPSALSATELLEIHEIAVERMGDIDPSSLKSAVELTREVMLVAVKRSA